MEKLDLIAITLICFTGIYDFGITPYILWNLGRILMVVTTNILIRTRSAWDKKRELNFTS